MFKIRHYIKHPLPKFKVNWRDHTTPKARVNELLLDIEQTSWYRKVDGMLSFSPRAWKARKISKFHRAAWILSTRGYRYLYKVAQQQYNQISLVDLYLEDYYIPNDIVMHSGYYAGE